MSQVNLADRAASTYLGAESTYGTTPSMTRVFPEAGSITLEQANLENSDEREHLFKALDPVLGLKSWSASLTFKLRPSSAQLDKDAVPAATLPGNLALVAAWGGEAYAAGSLVVSSTTTSITVTGGQGSRFKIGQLIAAEVSGALELARITNISTDTLTCWPAFSGAPTTTTGVVINGHAYWPVQEHSSSLTLQHAKALASAGHKWTCNGAMAAAALKIERGAILSYTAALKGSDWTFVSGDSIAVTAASESQAAPHVARDAIVIFQTPATSTRVNYVAESISVEIGGDGGNMLVPELGGVEGVNSVMRVGNRPMCTVTIKQRADVAMMTDYDAQTAKSLTLAFPRGSGTTKRFVALDIPRLVPNAVPQYASENGRFMVTQTYQAECDASTTTSGLTGSNYDHAVKPFGIYLL